MITPENLTPRERAAVLAAGRDGWIHPPLVNTLKATPDHREWFTADLCSLERKGLIRDRKRRLDGATRFLLNQAGMDLAAEMRRRAAQKFPIPPVVELFGDRRYYPFTGRDPQAYWAFQYQ